MKIYSFCIMSALALCLASCGNERASSVDAAAAVADTGAKTTTNQPGSGIYAFDCKAETGKYEIILSESADGFVSAQVTHDSGRFQNLLTSYSYMGDATPADFLVAIMFDPANAPVPEAEDARIEIWKGEGAYYALLNGNQDERLELCGDTTGS
jgi:hypothetical protein